MNLHRIPLAILLIGVAGLGPGFCQQPQARSGKESLRSDPLPLPGIIKWVAENQKNPPHLAHIYETGFISRIKKVGIAFQATDENLASIRSAGGSKELCNAIKEARAPLPEVPKPLEYLPAAPDLRFQIGLLTVDCRPAECIVLVNGGQFILPTVGGTLSQSLREGLVTTAAIKKDHDPDKGQQIVEVRQNRPAQVDFRFAVSPAALTRAGNSLFDRMIESLGGTAGLKESEAVQGTGRLISWYHGQMTEWSFSAFIDYPNKRRYSLAGRAQKFEISAVENEFRWKRQPQIAEVRELESCLHWFQDNQLAKVIANLQSSNFKKIAGQLTPVEGQPLIVRAVSENETYSIKLDPELRPAEVTLEVGGLDRGRTIKYSEYVKQGSATYPKHIQVIHKEESPHGVQVQFDNFKLGPPAGKKSRKDIKNEQQKAKK